MIVEYLRPDTIEEAIRLLKRNDPLTLPMGGGSVLSKSSDKPIAVVDLQNLGLNKIERFAGKIEIGATATLTDLDAFLKNDIFTNVVRTQAGKNQRNTGTFGGLVNMADGRSELLALLLAMDAQLEWQPLDQ